MRRNRDRAACCILAILILSSVAVAQTPVFRPLVPAVKFTRAVAVDGLIYAGLDAGGVAEFDPAQGRFLRHLDRTEGLGGHLVRDLAWSGTRLLVATADGGITAITGPGTANEIVQLYSTGLASLNVTCVTGQQVGSSERIFYGTDGDGIGVIEGGREGAYYTTPQLLDDTIEHVALSDGLLLIASPSGLTRFANNVFTTYPTDVTGWATVNDLGVTADGTIWLAMSDGLYTWNDVNEEPELRYGSGGYLALDIEGDRVVCLRSSYGVLQYENGVATALTVPEVDPTLDLDVRSTVTVDGTTWVGGSLREVADASGSVASRAWLARTGSATTTIHELEGSQIGISGGYDGAAVDQHGRAWVGDRAGDGIDGLADDGWYHVLSVASEENGYRGLLDHSGGVLSMCRAGQWIWFCQYTNGIVGFVPPAQPGGDERWLQLNKFHSPAQIDGIIALGGHPDGAVFVCSDAQSWWDQAADNPNLGVDVLFDPDNPLDEDSWLHIPTDDLGGGNLIRAAAVQRRDVVWFAVDGLGLMRWDINGSQAGADDELTWLDTDDDSWIGPIRYVDDGTLDLGATTSLAFEDDGTIWAGGAGLTRFIYSAGLDLTTLRGEWGRMEDAFTPGLLSASVVGLTMDRNADLWALTEAGLNRFRLHPDSEDVDVAAFTDLVTYTTLDWSLYSPGAIAPLPGGTYRELRASADGTRLVLTSDLGGVMLDVPQRQAEGGDDVETAYIYPNPFPGDDGASHISLGGLTVDDDNPLRLEILNLAGQIVYQNSNVDAAEEIWDGKNRLGETVAAGMYILKITQAGVVHTMPLAVTF